MDGPKVGDQVRRLRTARGWSQEKLAYAAGLSRAAIQNIETGKSARPKSLPDIAAALGVSVGDLYTEEQRAERHSDDPLLAQVRDLEERTRRLVEEFVRRQEEGRRRGDRSA